MRLWLFTIVAFLSLVATAATLLLWHRSYSTADSARVAYFTPYPDSDLVHEWYVNSSAGGLRVAQHLNYFIRGDGVKLQGRSLTTFGTPTYPFFGTRSLIPGRNHLSVWQRAGFEPGYSSEGTPPSVVEGIILPDWFCVLLLLIVPGLWLRFGLAAIRGKRRLAAGLCSRCGYDLRASSGRCPECGVSPRGTEKERVIAD
jgi:hypothetical protein